MPAEVKILIEGGTNADSVVENGAEKTCSTITLVRDGDLVMVVDPGVLESQQILVDALQKESLKVEDVNIVCITHSHIDHYRNVGMFPNAKILEFYGLWDKDTVENWSEDFTPNIKILRTPGHDNTGITLFVKTEQDGEYPGVVAICGDIFWRENYPQDPQNDVYASNPEKLQESRGMVLRLADWIVPGHAGIYKNVRLPDLPEKSGLSGRSKNGKDQRFGTCRKCKRIIKTKKGSCRCRPYLCHHCCECGLDCDLCGCSHIEGVD